MYASQFMANYSTFICHFESVKYGKNGKKLQKLNISGTRKTFLVKEKTFFIVFEGLSFVEKIKIDTSFNDVDVKVKVLQFSISEH